MKIELSSEELAEELQRHLEEKRFAGASYDKAQRTIEFPEDMSPAQWASLRGTVEKWARGRKLEIEESLKIRSQPEAAQAKTSSKEEEAVLRRRLEALTPKEAEARYDYLQRKPFSELTDEEYEERLVLAQTLSEKPKSK